MYASLALAGDLRSQPAVYLGAHGLLLLMMGLGWWGLRRRPVAIRLVVLGALLFRLLATLGPPSLSDDVYRYLWDGRVQLHGIHPYAHAPSDAALAELRDEDWTRINHPTIKTIYPPAAELTFLALAATRTGVWGFKLAAGLADFAVVLLLALVLERLSLPMDRLILYAWNPLAVMETAGSGHLEPVGVALVMLATVWLLGSRPAGSAVALATAVHVKLVPAVLIPAFAKRLTLGQTVLLGVVLAGLVLPYAVFGPAVGAGLFEYAERWEANAFVYAAIEGLLTEIDTGPPLKRGIDALRERVGDEAVDWGLFYRHVWPRDVARGVVALLLLVWVIGLAFRPGLDVFRECFLAMGAVLVLSPTVHPWYVLWILPFAVAYGSWAWLWFAATVPLVYLTPAGADVGWGVRLVEWLPTLVLLAAGGLGRGRGNIAR